MTSTLPPIVQAVSGALGSAIANTGSYPFDLVATKVQLSRAKHHGHGLRAALRILRRIVDTRGWPGLYDGLETDTGATLLSSFFYFYAHSFLRVALLRRKARTQRKAVLSVLEELLVGYLAGIGSRLVSTPLSLVTVRLQNEREKDDAEEGDAESGAESNAKGVGNVVRDLYAEGGLAGFWRGFTLTMLLSCNPGLTYAFTSFFLRRARPTPAQNFLAGASGNALAVCIIYPLVLAKTRLTASARRTTIRAVLHDAVSRDGILGLYQGLQVQVLKGFLNQGLTVMTKQRIEARMVQMYKEVM